MNQPSRSILAWVIGILAMMLVLSNAGWAYVTVDQAVKLEEDANAYSGCSGRIDTLLSMLYGFAAGEDQATLEDILSRNHFYTHSERKNLIADGVTFHFDENGMSGVEIAAMRKLFSGRR